MSMCKHFDADGKGNNSCSNKKIPDGYCNLSIRFMGHCEGFEKPCDGSSSNVASKALASFNKSKQVSDGSSADYYKLPSDSSQLQDLISAKNMNGQIAEIFRACYRYGEVAHSPRLRDAKKIQFYINEEIKRLEKYDQD